MFDKPVILDSVCLFMMNRKPEAGTETLITGELLPAAQQLPGLIVLMAIKNIR